MFENVESEKGKIIYITPSDLFHKQLKKGNEKKKLLLLGIFSSAIVSFILTIVVLIGGNGNFTLTLILSAITIILIILYFHDLPYMISDKLTIYEKGFSLPKKPLKFILNKKEYFFSYTAIKKACYGSWGMSIDMTLTDNSIICLSIGEKDYAGFIEFSKQLEKLSILSNKPDLAVVFDYMNAHSKWLRGEISKKAMNNRFQKMVSVNSEYSGIPNKN